MLRYNSFILENSVYKLVLESKVTFSDQFKGILSQIYSPIAKSLLSLSGVDKTLTQNYIDTDLSSIDMISFIQDNKANQMIDKSKDIKKIDTKLGPHLKKSGFSSEQFKEENSKIYSLLGLNIDECQFAESGEHVRVTGEIKSPFTEDRYYCAYQSITDPTKKAVINKKGIVDVSTGYMGEVWTKSRNQMRIGRLVRALLPLTGTSYSDTDVEQFVNEYKATIREMNDAFSHFGIVKGRDIVYWYNEDQYSAPNVGELGSSCMRFDSCHLTMYGDNPEVISLVILYDDNGQFTNMRSTDGTSANKYRSDKIIGRALLWTTTEGHKCMDRIYTTYAHDVDLFRKYAIAMGWSSVTAVGSSGLDRKRNIIVQLKHWSDDEGYPYMDSMDRLNSETGELSDNGNIINSDRYISYEDGEWG